MRLIMDILLVDVLVDFLNLKMGVGRIRWHGDFGERCSLFFPFPTLFPVQFKPAMDRSSYWMGVSPSKRSMVTSGFLKTVFRTYWAPACTDLTLIAQLDVGTSPAVLQIWLRLVWLSWYWGPFHGQQENKVSSITEIGQGSYSGAACFSPWIRD